MSFEQLTSILVTIAALSASFIAILGGMITSKLLNIYENNEKNLKLVKDINEEIKARNIIIGKSQEVIDRDEALYYIKKKITSIINNKELEEIYDNSDPNILEFNVLKKYWNNALNCHKFFIKKLDDISEFNEDNIPKNIAAIFKDDYFSYEICKMISRYFINIESNPDLLNLNLPALNILENNTIEKNKEIISELEIKKSIILRELNFFHKHKKIKTGLVILMLFIFLNIILPLIFLLFETKHNYIVALLFIIILLLSFISIIIYINSFLKIKTNCD